MPRSVQRIDSERNHRQVAQLQAGRTTLLRRSQVVNEAAIVPERLAYANTSAPVALLRIGLAINGIASANLGSAPAFS